MCFQQTQVTVCLHFFMAILLPLALSCTQFHSIACHRRPAFVRASACLGSSGIHSRSHLASQKLLFPFDPHRYSPTTVSRQNLYQLKPLSVTNLMDFNRNETLPMNTPSNRPTLTYNSSTSFFHEQQFHAFQQAIEEIVSKKNVIRDFRKNEKDLQIVKSILLSKERTLPKWDIHHFLPPKRSADDATQNTGGTDAQKKAAMLYTKQKLTERRQMYLNQTGLTIAQHRLATTLLAHLADHCAKTTQPTPLYVAWEKILEGGMTPLSRVLSTYLYALGLDESEDNSDRDFAAEVAIFHDAVYEPTEKTITLLVKSLVRRGDAAGAEALLDGIADGELGDLRHRTTSPILKLYCEKGDVDSAFRLYHRMRTTSRVKMDAETYCGFIASVAECGYFRSDSKPIVGATDLGYSSASGSGLLDALVSDMAEDVLDISEEMARLLHNGFAMGFKESGMTLLQQSDDMLPLTSLCDPHAIVADRVRVDRDTGRCPATNATLRLIVLEESQRLHVHDTLLEMARVKSVEYTSRLEAKGRATRDNAEQAELATQILKDFSDWLETREGRPYTAIIDGPNVAYFGWGRVNLNQLILMVDELEKQGEHPLVIMPEKYTRRKFHLRQGLVCLLWNSYLCF
ncbi:hypothetical protein HJC23_006362 [Cyclotella cryptica]|uniref:Uncharacterized protein n=1 Tax=Cyclotella cryptica TaxID=29204 RepID=A0ABD3Q4T9_9STRA|eukprot:CCRYP_008768-RC/>CCRYP_008768-RC protein AED:0.03 eAED:0.03 QI:170/1/1/1/1/0.75/4/585/627